MKTNSKIPSELNALIATTANNEESIRGKARETFLEMVYKPGTNNVAAALNVVIVDCIPEMLRLVSDQNVPQREWYLHQLLRFSIGEPLHMDYHGYDFKRYGMHLEKIPKNVYEQLLKNIKPIITLLKDNNVVLRAYVAYFLSFLSEQKKVSYPAIVEAWQVEQNEEARVAFEMALSTLDGYEGKDDFKPLKQDFGKSLMKDIGIAWRFHKYDDLLNQQLEHANGSLATLLKSKDKPSSKIIPWCNGDLLRIATIALAGAQPSDSDRIHQRKVLLPILSRASESTEWGNEAAITALYQVFGSCTMTAPPAKGWRSPKDIPAPLYELIGQCMVNPTLLTEPVLNALGQNGVPKSKDKLEAFFK